MSKIGEIWKSASPLKKFLIVLGGAAVVASLVAFAAPLLAPLGSTLASKAGMASVLKFSTGFKGALTGIGKFLLKNSDAITKFSTIATAQRSASVAAQNQRDKLSGALAENQSKQELTSQQNFNNDFDANAKTFSSYSQGNDRILNNFAHA